MPQGAILVEVTSGRVLQANAAAVMLLGRTRESLLDLHWRELQASSDAPEMADGIMVSRLYRCGDGSERMLDTSFTLLPQSDPKAPARLLVLLTPCAERLRNEEERKEMLQALEEEKRLRVLGQLAGGVAHDYNNLLAVIAGNLEVMLRDGVSLEALEECRATVERARGLSRQILRFARKAEPAQEFVLLDEVVNRMGALIGVRTTVVMDGKPLCLHTDAAELEAALVNLITNAKEAVGASGKVEIKAQRLVLRRKHAYFRGRLEAGEYLSISIADNGPGIPKELHERLFEPYFTTKSHKGLGLGLARVGAYVEFMKGAIDLETSPQKGTRWELLLPAQKCPCSHKAECQRRAKEKTATASIFKKAPERLTDIAVVDDEPALVRLVEKLLQREGYRSLGFTQPKDALEELSSREGSFVLITDAKMPGLSGVGLVRALRSAHRRFAAVLMSGYTEELSAATGDLFEATLEKPLSMGMLMAAVRDATKEL